LPCRPGVAAWTRKSVDNGHSRLSPLPNLRIIDRQFYCEGCRSSDLSSGFSVSRVYPGWRATAPLGCGASGVQAFAYLVSVNAGRFWDGALAPQLIEQIHDRIVQIAQDKGVADGAWILWSRPETQAAYRQLLNSTSRVVGQAKRFSTEVATDVKRSTDVLRQLALENLRCQIDAMVPLVRQVMKQTRARIWHGDTRADGKILSLFEPATEVIRKRKTGKLNEFGKMVKLQEAESQIVTDYEVYAQRPNDVDLLIGAIETHQARLGRTPRLVATDAAFYSAKNEVAAKAKGVKRVCIPNRSTKSRERKREQKKG